MKYLGILGKHGLLISLKQGDVNKVYPISWELFFPDSCENVVVDALWVDLQKVLTV